MIKVLRMECKLKYVEENVFNYVTENRNLIIILLPTV